MDNLKSQWVSRGVWGGILGVLAGIVGVARYFWPDAPEGLEEQVAAPATLDVVMAVVTMGAGALAYWGRLKATAILTSVPALKGRLR